MRMAVRRKVSVNPWGVTIGITAIGMMITRRARR